MPLISADNIEVSSSLPSLPSSDNDNSVTLIAEEVGKDVYSVDGSGQKKNTGFCISWLLKLSFTSSRLDRS